MPPRAADFSPNAQQTEFPKMDTPRFHTRSIVSLLVLLSSFVSPSHAQQPAGKKRGPTGNTTISGLVVPSSEKNLALRTRGAQIEFEWNEYFS